VVKYLWPDTVGFLFIVTDNYQLYIHKYRDVVHNHTFGPGLLTRLCLDVTCEEFVCYSWTLALNRPCHHRYSVFSNHDPDCCITPEWPRLMACLCIIILIIKIQYLCSALESYKGYRGADQWMKSCCHIVAWPATYSGSDLTSAWQQCLMCMQMFCHPACLYVEEH